MTKRSAIFGALLTSASCLLGVVPAHALTYLAANAAPVWFTTGSAVAAVAGTYDPSGDDGAPVNSGGGLCAWGATGCSTYLNPNNKNQPLFYPTGPINVVNGSEWIAIQVPTADFMANYLLTVNITGKGPDGDIYDVIAGANTATASSIGTTSVVAPNADGTSTGPVSGVLNLTGGDTVYITVTDLLQQWTPVTSGSNTYTLPEILGGGSASTLSGGSDPQSQFALSYTLTLAPEPASVSLLTGGVAAVGALRWRRRQALAADA